MNIDCPINRSTAIQLLSAEYTKRLQDIQQALNQELGTWLDEVAPTYADYYVMDDDEYHRQYLEGGA